MTLLLCKLASQEITYVGKTQTVLSLGTYSIAAGTQLRLTLESATSNEIGTASTSEN